MVALTLTPGRGSVPFAHAAALRFPASPPADDCESELFASRVRHAEHACVVHSQWEGGEDSGDVATLRAVVATCSALDEAQVLRVSISVRLSQRGDCALVSEAAVAHCDIPLALRHWGPCIAAAQPVLADGAFVSLCSVLAIVSSPPPPRASCRRRTFGGGYWTPNGRGAARVPRRVRWISCRRARGSAPS